MSTEPSMLDEILGDLVNDPDYIAEGLALGLVEDAIGIMETQGMSKARLAEAMHVSRAYVTKVFNAPPNLTLRTIAQIGLAIGARPVVRLEPVSAHGGALAPAASALTPQGAIGMAATTLLPVDVGVIDSFSFFSFIAPGPVFVARAGQSIPLTQQEAPWISLKNSETTWSTSVGSSPLASEPSKATNSQRPPTTTALSLVA